MSTYDYLDVLDEPRRGVPTYQNLERLVRLGQYNDAITLLEKNPKFQSQLTIDQLRKIRSIAAKYSATERAASLLSYLRENTSLGFSLEQLEGNDVY